MDSIFHSIPLVSFNPEGREKLKFDRIHLYGKACEMLENKEVELQVVEGSISNAHIQVAVKAPEVSNWDLAVLFQELASNYREIAENEADYNEDRVSKFNSYFEIEEDNEPE